MSQYVPGVIDYIPQIQPYKPNLNFFQQVLQTKQAQYNAGYDKLSSLYGTLLQSPMLKSENIELRNKFFNDISANITKISGMDLSNQQNVSAAQKIFQPLIDNDYIMKDMAFTKKYQQAVDRHEYFKNCLDEKKCGGKYWDEGLQYVQYQAEDFIKSSLDESLSFSNPEYIPYTNAVQKAVQLAKDMDFKVITPSKSGGFIVRTENGTQMIPDLTDFFISNFANDGNVRQTYNVLSYLKRKNYSKNNADYFGGSEDQAEQHYLDTMASFISSTTEKEKERALAKLDLAKGKQRLGEQIVKNVGVDPNDPNDQGIINDIEQSITDQLIAQDSVNLYDDTNQKVASNSFKSSDISAKRNRIDAAMADSLFAADMMSAASSYSKLTSKVLSMEADPFLLKDIEHRNAVALENLRAKNAEDLARKKGEILEPIEEPPVSDPMAPGGSFENADLLTQEESIQRTYDANAGGAISKAAIQWDADITTILGLPLGTPLTTGAVVTKELKEELSRARESVFNQGETRTRATELRENSVADYLWTDLKSSLYSAWNWITGDSPEIVQAKEKEYTNQELNEEADVTYKDVPVPSKGFLNAYGQLTEPTTHPSYFDKNSVNHYDKVYERLNAVYSDPANTLLKAAIGLPSGDLKLAMDRADKQKAYAKIENDRIAHNVAVITASSNNMDIDLSDYDDPELAKTMLSKITYGNNDKKYFVPKEEFVSNYVKAFRQKGNEYEAKRLEKKKQLDAMSWADRAALKWNTGEGYMPEQPLYSTSDAQLQKDAADMYESYMEKFRSEYNRADDATKPYADFRTYNPFGGGGSGGQAHPFTIRGVDPRFPLTPGASSFKWTYNDLTRAIADPELSDRVAVFNGDPGKYTAETISDVMGKQDANLISILQMTRDDMGQMKKGDDAARFDITAYPIAGNSGDLVAVKIKHSPRFIESHKGGKETPGITAGVQEIGIIMPRSAISPDNPLFAGIDRTDADIIMDAYKEVNITRFSEFGGRAKITRGPGDKGFNYELFTMVPDANGKLIEVLSSSGYNDELSAGKIASGMTEYLKKEYDDNYKLYYQNKNNTKDQRITKLDELGINP